MYAVDEAGIVEGHGTLWRIDFLEEATLLILPYLAKRGWTTGNRNEIDPAAMATGNKNDVRPPMGWRSAFRFPKSS